MLKRTGFARKTYAPAPAAPLTRATRAGSYAASPCAAPIPKERMVRSEAYRLLVASLPCINCRRIGRSQAAHPPPTGKSLKEDDRQCFPLCADELARTGCHTRFDQYQLFPADQMREQALAWAQRTRNTIEAARKWPAGVPKWGAT
ncbi:MAG: hypothetical protein H0X13_19880 [Ramlibacter sp.]|nr:hypothetical protein [Ramlibacter sp.]